MGPVRSIAQRFDTVTDKSPGDPSGDRCSPGDLTDHTPSPWLWLADLECADLSPAVAGSFAADLPALRSTDPRDEPALRNEITTWWNRTVQALRHSPELLHAQPHCPEPGAAFLKSVTAGEGGASGALDDLPTAHGAELTRRRYPAAAKELGCT